MPRETSNAIQKIEFTKKLDNHGDLKLIAVVALQM